MSGEQNQVIDRESFIFEHSIVGLGTYSMYYVCYLVSWLLGKLKNIFPVPIFIEPNACIKYSNILLSIKVKTLSSLRVHMRYFTSAECIS